MGRSGIATLIVYGRGVVGEYGLVHYLTGFFPSHKGAYVVAPVGSMPTILVASESEARAVRGMVGERIEVASATESSTEAYVARVAELARSHAESGAIGLAAGGAGGFPAKHLAHLTSLLRDEDIRDATDLLFRAKSHVGPDEAQGLRTAVTVAEAGLDAFARGARLGMSEWEAAGLIERELRGSGALTTLVHVSGGPFLGQPPTNRRISSGDVATVIVELTSQAGYWVELGALFSCGEISAVARQLAESCIQCIQDCPASLGASKRSVAVAHELKERIASFGGRPVIGLGHGVGIDEGPPVISTSDDGRIEDATALAMHPSIGNSDMSIALAVANTYLIKGRRAEALSAYPDRLYDVQ